MVVKSSLAWSGHGVGIDDSHLPKQPFYSTINESLGRTGSDSNEKVLRIPQCSNITEALPSGCLYYDSHWGGSYLYTEMQSVYSAAPAYSANICTMKCVCMFNVYTGPLVYWVECSPMA